MMIIGYREISVMCHWNKYAFGHVDANCSKLHFVCDHECNLATNRTLGAEKIIKVPIWVDDLCKHHGKASYKHMEVPTMQRVKTYCIMLFPAL